MALPNPSDTPCTCDQPGTIKLSCHHCDNRYDYPLTPEGMIARCPVHRHLALGGEYYAVLCKSCKDDGWFLVETPFETFVSNRAPNEPIWGQKTAFGTARAPCWVYQYCNSKTCHCDECNHSACICSQPLTKNYVCPNCENVSVVDCDPREKALSCILHKKQGSQPRDSLCTDCTEKGFYLQFPHCLSPLRFTILNTKDKDYQKDVSHF